MSRDLHILARPHPGEQTFIGSVIGILHANIIPAGIFINLLCHCTMIIFTNIQYV